MPTISTIEVPFWVINVGIGVIAVGALVVCWSLFGDALRRWRRRDKTPRCPRCWYNMTGAASLRCPECGHDARRPARLQRSKRGWFRCLLGLLIAGVGVGGLYAQTIANLPWIPWTPTPLLIWLVGDPMIPAPGWTFARSGGSQNTCDLQQGLVYELWRRYATDELTLDQKREVARKQFNGRPPFVVESRTRWPASGPVYFKTSWGASGVKERRLVATSRIGGVVQTETATSYWFADSEHIGWPQFGMQAENLLRQIDDPPPGMTEIAFDVQVFEGTDEVWASVASTPIELVEKVDEILKPVGSRTTADTWRQALVNAKSVSVVEGWVRIEPPRIEELQGVTMGVWFELLHDGELVSAAPMVWTYASQAMIDAEKELDSYGGLRRFPWGGGGTSERDSDEKWQPFPTDTTAYITARPNKPGWSLRIRGDGHLALRDFNAVRYWNGEITLAPGEFRTDAPPIVDANDE